MKPPFWNLIIISPHSPSLQKIRISWRAMAILGGAFVLSFWATVALLLMYPRVRIDETELARLVVENQALRIENRIVTLRIRKLDSDVRRLEGVSHPIAALTTT